MLDSSTSGWIVLASLQTLQWSFIVFVDCYRPQWRGATASG